MVGKQLGRYKLVEEIGQGGMAVVYRGVDTTLQREVAVKILHPHLSRKESNRQRFAREARVVATLHHDNIVEIYDFSGGEAVNGADANDAFIVCEYIRGRTLADFIEKTASIPVEVGVMIIVEICEAVAHAHAANIVHRDIKPENVMIRQDGILKLMDFGIARVTDDSGSTMTGTLMGSPQYMSPEQVNGEELGPRSDLFSIGVLLYRLVTGVLPFDGGNPAAILRAILEGDPVEPDRMNPLVGRELARTLGRALAKDPRDRHEGVRELANELLATIADAGLGSTREELRAYFADPAAYGRSLRERLITRYARAGHERAKRRDIAGAMELWSRVLELDPENRDVRDALERMGRGQRNKRVVALALGVPLLGVTLGIGGWKTYEWIDSWPTPTPIAIATTPPRTPTPTPATPTPTASIEKPTPKSSAVPSATATQVAMIATPKPIPAGHGVFDPVGFQSFYAKVALDGYEKGELLALKGGDGIVVKPKSYTLAIKAIDASTGCAPFVGTVIVEEGKRTTAILDANARALSPDDLYLRGCKRELIVRTNPPVDAAEVILDGSVVGKIATVLPVTTGDHTLAVRAEGFAENHQPLRIRPKQGTDAHEITVELVPIPKPKQ